MSQLAPAQPIVHEQLPATPSKHVPCAQRLQAVQLGPKCPLAHASQLEPVHPAAHEQLPASPALQVPCWQALQGVQVGPK